MTFSGKTSLSVKNLYLLAFPDDKAEILVVCFNFLTNTHFYNKFFINHDALAEDKVVLFTKNKSVSLL